MLQSYFANIQSVYDISLKATDKLAEFQFMSAAMNLSSVRTEFIAKLEELNMIRIEADPEYVPNFKQWEAFETLYTQIQGKLRSIKNSTDSKKSDSQIKSQPHCQLPPIKLPNFDGNARAWPLFIECYNRNIHNNELLTDSDKMYYLCGQLSDQALETISGISPTASNYQLIYSSLVEKYQDTRELGTAYLDEIFNYKKLQSPSCEGLKHFIDKFTISVSAFERLDISDKLNFVFLYLALKKVDYDTARSFENSVRGEKIPSYDIFVKFVKEQARILRRTEPEPRGNSRASGTMGQVPLPPKSIGPSQTKQSRSYVTASSKDTYVCPLCGDTGHDFFSKCTDFLKLTAKERYNILKRYNGCITCLSMYHKTSECKNKTNCGNCHSRSHHTLLHFKSNESTTALPVSQSNDFPVSDECLSSTLSEEHTSGIDSEAGISLCSMQSAKSHDSLQSEVIPSTVLLATARVRVNDAMGNLHFVRCLVDSGSQNHFITAQCCERLSLTSRQPDVPISICGFGGSSQPVKGVAELKFFSRFDNKQHYKIRPLVVDIITSRLPSAPVDAVTLSYLSSIPLADDQFHLPGEIDMLIGAQLFAQLLLPGRVQGPPGMPDAIQTTLGFIVMGEIPVKSKILKGVTLCAFTDNSMQDLVSKFWQFEEVPSAPATCLSPEEQKCESFYRSTTTRDASGRYMVALPFKSDPNHLGTSLNVAKRRYAALERKFRGSPQLHAAYDAIIREYLEAGILYPTTANKDIGYVIPHHGVIKNDKLSTKLRIVLDASARTDKGLSLNQTLHSGPNLQGDIFYILLNFRLFPIAFCADVKQMYLQIRVHPHYNKYLRLLYRLKPNEEVQLLEFDRVCFGLSVSPFLALRTVKQLCEDEGSKFPAAMRIVPRDLFMDDVVSSEKTVPEAADAVLQLIGLFKAGGFELVKWSSNSWKLLSKIPETHLHPQAVKFDDNTSQKILGVKWEPQSDSFSFEVTPCSNMCTKRNILSVVARLWDVLGFAAPVILYAKLLIQKLWELRIDWDDSPPPCFVEKWNRFRRELSLLSNLSIPRHSGVVEHSVITLVGFSDASEKAYGAAIYLHSQTPNGVAVRLLCAKSRVAPLKTVSLARLELCAALLMAQLMHGIRDNYSQRVNIDRIFAFSDSTVTLHWINASPHRWKAFVANRVTKIQNKLDSSHFFHIDGKDNPSDCLSRGLLPSQLLDHPLWFQGPSWLQENRSEWPIKQFKIDRSCETLEARAVALPIAQCNPPLVYTLAKRFSSWSKYLRVVAYVLRFARKLNSRGSPSAADLTLAELFVVRAVQSMYFSNVIKAVESGKGCNKSIQKLRPILVDGILRVGGRLGQAALTFDPKHPMLLPRKDYITDLIINHTHRRNCHTGPHLLLSILRQRYWILAGRNIVRARVHACNICFRTRPKLCSAPVMAELPTCRLQISKPFAHTGLDYCGPINITLTRRRGIKSQKAYICVFLCLTTRAVHVELVPNLSTDAFLNALKRFLSRRGPVQKLFSDNGTNFVGARAYLNELYQFLDSKEYKEEIHCELADRHIEWEMIPPSAPHFGGGWESTVKSFKQHLIRVIGAQILTYEELLTVLVQIEAVLNSRPLGQALSPDPAEPIALTPSHFLHTSPLGALPSAPVVEDIGRLRSRLLLLDKLVQSYWNRWSIEYLHTLQERQKWLTDSNPIEKGTVVIISQPNQTSPLTWPLGIIVETYPGTDRRTRVVAVKTKNGIIKRTFVSFTYSMMKKDFHFISYFPLL